MNRRLDHLLRRTVVVPIAAAALVLVGAVAPTSASALVSPHADLAVRSNHLSTSVASVGDLVTFTIVAVNRGTARSTLDVVERMPAALALVSETCDQGISADTPFCEYIERPGVPVTTVVVARVLPAAAGKVLTPHACVMSEGDTRDPDHANDCRWLTLTVRG